MFKKIDWKFTFMSALIAAFLFCTCVFIYIKEADYTVSWVLYLGSFMFFFTIATTTVQESNKGGKNKSTVEHIFSSLIKTFVGIVISIISCFILLMIMDRGFILPGPAAKILKDAPASTIQGKTGGLVFKVFFAATFLCLFGGLIASITIPFYIKRRQAKTSR